MSQEIRVRDSAVYGQLAHESAVVALTAAGPTGESALRPLLEESLNWDTVVSLVTRERAVGPVARDLNRLGTGTVPKPVLERLARMGLVTGGVAGRGRPWAQSARFYSVVSSQVPWSKKKLIQSVLS